MASTVKVAVAALYLAQVDHGRRSLDDTINGQSARSLMSAMLIHSDNRATDILLKDLGGPGAVHDWLQRQRRHRPARRPHHRPAAAATSATCGTAAIRARRWRWSTCCSRIYRAELIKPQSRNYLLDLMAQCQTGKNRMKALLPCGHAGRAQDRHARRPHRRRRLHHLARRPPGRGRDLRARRRRPAAHHRRDRARDLRRLQVGLHLAVRRARAHQQVGAAPHRRAREDRPLSGGRAGRALSEAHRLADQGHRAARPRRQDARACRRTASPSCSTSAARPVLGRAGEEARSAGATAASARRAS